MDMIYLAKYFFFVGYIRVESPMSHTAQYCVFTRFYLDEKPEILNYKKSYGHGPVSSSSLLTNTPF